MEFINKNKSQVFSLVCSIIIRIMVMIVIPAITVEFCKHFSIGQLIMMITPCYSLVFSIDCLYCYNEFGITPLDEVLEVGNKSYAGISLSLLLMCILINLFK